MRNIREWIARERWFVLAVLFLLVNVYGVLRLTGRTGGAGGEIRITDVSPGPERPLTGTGEIRWTFSAGMVDDSGVGSRLPDNHFSFTPQVQGRYYWESPRTLVFVPGSEWSPGRRYLAAPKKNLIAPDGRSLPTGPAFEFRTEPLRLTEVSQADITPSRELSLRLIFNAPVSRASFQGSFSLLGPSGEPIDWRFDGPSTGRTFLIKTGALPPERSQLSVELKEGMQGTDGPLGLEEAVSRRVEIRDDLALLGLHPRMNAFAGGEIEASFTTALDPGTARNFLTFDPEVNFTIEEMYSYGYRSSVRIRGDFQPGQVYALTLHDGLRARGGSRLAGDVVRNVYFPDRPASIIFKDRGHYLSPASACLVPIRTVNLNRFTAVFGCSVTETGGRTVTAYSARPVDPYPFYIGVRTEESGAYFPAGRPIGLEAAAVRPSGEADPEAPDLEFTASLVTWSTVLKKKEEGSYAYVSERQLQPAGRQVIRLEEGSAGFSYVPDQPGQYLLLVRDPLSGSSTSLTLYAGTPDQEWIAWSMERPERVELSLDRERYRPGEEAILAIRSPFPGRALVTVESDAILEERIISLKKNTAEISIPVRSGYAPNVFCTVTVIRAVAPGEVWAPHRAAGAISLPIDVSENRLSLSVSAPATARPKTKLAAVLSVTDASGAPVESEVLVAAVDEGVCSLTDFPSPDPFTFFMGPRRLGVSLFDIYALLLPEVDGSVLGSPSPPGGDGMEETLARRLNPVTVRRFRPVALWSGWTKTGPDGRAIVEFEVPEFTGELRLMASAVSKRAFGSATRPVTVKRNLVVRVSLPRFLAPDDRCLMPVRVFNETGHDGEARIEVSCSGGLTIGESGMTSARSSRTLFLPEGSSEETIFGIAAPAGAGPGAVSLRARMGDEVFEETTELSVRPAASLQSRAAAGMVPPGETAVITIPGEWLSGTVRQEFSLSGRPGVQLAGNLTDLLRYPYGCVEQTTSGVFPLLYLADLAEEDRPGSIGFEECRRLVDAGIHRLFSMQTVAGGFGYWPGDREPYEWGSVYATHFLVEAVRAGYGVPDDRLKSATGYLSGLLERSAPLSERDDDRSWRDDRCLKSYACLVLALAGIPSPGWTARLAEQEERLDQSSRLNVAGALLAEGRREAAGRILAAVSPSMPPEEPETGGCLRSGSRTAAAALSLWMDLDPANPAVPALVRRLEGACREGYWRTTQEKSLALMALGRYCRYLSREEEPEGFRAVVSGLPDRKEIGSEEVAGRAVTFSDETDGPIRVENEGPGTVYYSWRMEGVPVSGPAAEKDRGISIRRRFLDMEGEEIVAADLEQGDPVVIEITVDGAGDEIDNLVITDLLPAGLEIENPAFSTSRVWTGKKSTLPVRHADLRDDRLIIFAGSFSGKKTYYYLARAVTPGDYTYPPITAECMYDPDMSSVSGGGRIRVEL